MDVPILDLTSQYETIRDEVLAAVQRVADTQRFILGPEVEALEDAVAAYCGCTHGVGVSSGTDALLVSLTALGIGPGDGVLTTPFTFFATAGVISRVGARPLFVDIDPATFNMDPAALAAFLDEACEPGPRPVHRATGARLRALLPVHLFGQVTDTDTLLGLARDRELPVLEDAAQAVGAEAEGVRAGSFGIGGCLSFFPTKNLGGWGDGGMVVTRDPDFAETLRMLRVHGSRERYFHERVGGNFRLDALQAAVLRVKLKHLPAWEAARRRHAAYYTETLESLDGVIPPTEAGGRRHVFNQYVIRADRRDALRTFLSERSIGTEIYYPIPVHLQRCYRSLGLTAGAFPESERAAAEVLALPVYPELAEAQQDHVVRSIREFYERTGANP